MMFMGDIGSAAPAATVTKTKKRLVLGKYYRFPQPIRAEMIFAGDYCLSAWDKYEFERGRYVGASNNGLLAFRGRPSNAQMLIPVGTDEYKLGWLAEFTFFIPLLEENQAVLDGNQNP